MQTTIRLAALAAALLAAGAQAQVYVEGNYAWTKISGNHGLNSDPTPQAFLGIIGYDLHPNLAIEGALGGGVRKDNATATINGVNYDVESRFKSTYGLYLKPRYHFSDQWEVFGRVGYMRTKIELMPTSSSSAYVGRSDTHGSTAWGLGANYMFDRNTYLTLGYNRFYDTDGLTVKGVNLGLGYRF